MAAGIVQRKNVTEGSFAGRIPSIAVEIATVKAPGIAINKDEFG